MLHANSTCMSRLRPLWDFRFLKPPQNHPVLNFSRVIQQGTKVRHGGRSRPPKCGLTNVLTASTCCLLYLLFSFPHVLHGSLLLLESIHKFFSTLRVEGSYLVAKNSLPAIPATIEGGHAQALCSGCPAVTSVVLWAQQFDGASSSLTTLEPTLLRCKPEHVGDRTSLLQD